MKKIFAFALVVMMFFSCARQHEGTVTILHTNDMHSQFLPMEASWVKQDTKPLVGGMSALSAHIEKLKKEYDPVLLLDGGDFMTGTPISKIVVDGAKGGGFLAMMNLIGYDAITIGNHEFDEGVDNIKALMKLADFDVLCANLEYNDKPLISKGYKIYKVNGIRIGVIGLLLDDLARVTAANRLKGVIVLDPVSTAQKIINKIDRKTDMIILLTHQGYEEDIDLAKKIKNADIIIGAHSHTRVSRPEKINGVIVLQAGSKTTSLGRITATVQADTISRYEYKLSTTWVDSSLQADQKMTGLVAKYQAVIDSVYGQVIGKLVTRMDNADEGESSSGNFITDAIREKVGSDFALLNSGGIRKKLQPGPITKLDIDEMLPFANYIVTFTCSGEELMSLLETNAQAAISSSHSILQMSGMRYSFRKNQNGKAEIVDATIGGKTIELHKKYTGATVDFVLDSHAMHYMGFEPVENNATGILLSDLVVEYISDKKEINPGIDNRINQIDN